MTFKAISRLVKALAWRIAGGRASVSQAAGRRCQQEVRAGVVPLFRFCLYMSRKTVETHIGAIFTKLGLAPAAEDHRRVLAVLAFLRH